jgi:hypothetical protein
MTERSLTPSLLDADFAPGSRHAGLGVYRSAPQIEDGRLNMLSKRILLLSIAASALAFAAPTPLAAQTYPDKPIKIIVTVAAGGPMDTIARFVGQQMQARLGQPVVVENRPGAGSTLGGKAVATGSLTAAP